MSESKIEIFALDRFKHRIFTQFLAGAEPREYQINQTNSYVVESCYISWSGLTYSRDHASYILDRNAPGAGCGHRYTDTRGISDNFCLRAVSTVERLGCIMFLHVRNDNAFCCGLIVKNGRKSLSCL